MVVAANQIDSTIDIATPENIGFQYQVAGPFRRLPAFLIDLIIRMLIWGALAVAVAITDLLLGGLASAFGLLAWFVLEWFYGGLFEAYWNGQTPGKRLLGIRVVTVEGQPINAMQAVLRNVLRFADMMPIMPFMLPTFVVGLITASLNRRYQRLGDLVCGTMVIVEQRSWLLGVVRLKDPRAAELAALLPADFEVSRSLARALATYVERRDFFGPARRREIARHLGEPLLERFDMARDTSHDLLLCALYYRTFVAEGADQNPESGSTVGPAISPFGGTVGSNAWPQSVPVPGATDAGRGLENINIVAAPRSVGRR